jgi:hypothetical protein
MHNTLIPTRGKAFVYSETCIEDIIKMDLKNEPLESGIDSYELG